jgi:hypothetical protein
MPNNPYGITAIRQALEKLAQFEGKDKADYLDVEIDVELYLPEDSKKYIGMAEGKI